MSSTVQICNLSLRHLGISKEIASLTERSNEAAACNRFYEPTRDMVLRGFPWPFAKKSVTLGLVTDSDDDDHPTTEWDYSYRYPTDCAIALRIESGIRNDTRQSRIPFEIYQDESARLIYTDQENAVLQYTKNETNSERYTPDVVMALSFLLAYYIAPSLTAGDPFKLGVRAFNSYLATLDQAKAAASNEAQAEEVPDAESIRARQ